MTCKRCSLILVLIFLTMCLPGTIFGVQVKIQGDYCYQYGDSESLMVAKEISYALALRKAVETYRTFIASTSVLENFQLKKDLVENIVSGYVENIKILRQDVKKRTVCTELIGFVNPEAVERIISKRIKIVSEQQSMKFQGIANNVYLKILNYRILIDTGNNKHLNVSYQVKESPPLGGVRMVVFCYDEHGNPIKTSFCDIVPTSSFKGAFGEQICIMPSDTVSINIRF